MAESDRPDLVVVTGLSGSGKSQAVKAFEDLGYYTLDNLPPALMPQALDISRKGGHERVAFVIDARSGALFAEASAALDTLARNGTKAHVLFFDASDEVLLRRYSETRHRHPLEQSGGVQPSIDEERRVLVDLRERSRPIRKWCKPISAVTRLRACWHRAIGYEPTGSASSAIPPPERGRSASEASRVGVNQQPRSCGMRAPSAGPPPDSICFEAKQMLSTSPFQGEV